MLISFITNRCRSFSKDDTFPSEPTNEDIIKLSVSNIPPGNYAIIIGTGLYDWGNSYEINTLIRLEVTQSPSGQLSVTKSTPTEPKFDRYRKVQISIDDQVSEIKFLNSGKPRPKKLSAIIESSDKKYRKSTNNCFLSQNDLVIQGKHQIAFSSQSKDNEDNFHKFARGKFIENQENINFEPNRFDNLKINKEVRYTSSLHSLAETVNKYFEEKGSLINRLSIISHGAFQRPDSELFIKYLNDVKTDTASLYRHYNIFFNFQQLIEKIRTEFPNIGSNFTPNAEIWIYGCLIGRDTHIQEIIKALFGNQVRVFGCFQYIYATDSTSGNSTYPESFFSIAGLQSYLPGRDFSIQELSNKLSHKDHPEKAFFNFSNSAEWKTFLTHKYSSVSENTLLPEYFVPKEPIISTIEISEQTCNSRINSIGASLTDPILRRAILNLNLEFHAQHIEELINDESIFDKKNQKFKTQDFCSKYISELISQLAKIPDGYPYSYWEMITRFIFDNVPDINLYPDDLYREDVKWEIDSFRDIINNKKTWTPKSNNGVKVLFKATFQDITMRLPHSYFNSGSIERKTLDIDDWSVV